MAKSDRYKLKASLYEEQDHRCNLCLIIFPINNLELDHIHPKFRGGQDWLDNFQLLCGFCNRVKSNKTQDEALAYVVRNK